MKNLFLVSILIFILSCTTSNNENDEVGLFETIGFAMITGQDRFPFRALIEDFVKDDTPSNKYIYYCGYDLDIDHDEEEEITDQWTTDLGKGSAVLTYDENANKISITFKECSYTLDQFGGFDTCEVSENPSVTFNGTLISDVSDIESSNTGTITMDGSVTLNGFWNFTCEVDYPVFEIRDGEVYLQATEGNFCGYELSDLLKEISKYVGESNFEDQEEFCRTLDL